MTTLIEELGGRVVALPTIEIRDPDSWAPLDGSIRKLASGLYRWVVFFSSSGVDRFFRRLDAAGLDARALAGTKIAAVGRATADSLRSHGIHADLVPSVFTASAVADEMGSGSGKVLVPRVAGAPPEPVAAIQARHWTVEEVPAYKNVIPPVVPSAVADVRAGEFDVVTFTSASSVRNLVQLLGAPDELGLAFSGGPPGKQVVCIGPSTSQAATDAGFRVDAVANEHSAEGIVTAIVDLREVQSSP